MKNTIKLIILLLLVCNYSIAQGTNGFVLKGNIEGLKDGTNIYLLINTGDTVSNTKSNGSTFHFSGNIDGEANWYAIRVDTNIVGEIGKKRRGISNALWLTNSKLVISGSTADWEKLKLAGSEPHDDYTEVQRLFNPDITDKNRDSVKNWIVTHKNSIYVADLIIKVANVCYPTDTDLQGVYNMLTNRAKTSFWGKKLANLVSRSKVGLEMGSTGKIPDFKITTPEGNISSVLTTAGNSKYTLIDFWASWCAPCRKAIPKLQKTYDMFHAMGFNIIGVSRDKKEADWKKALQEDKTPWTHGLDNIDNAGENIFGLQAIPGYILIDQRGKIIQSELLSKLNSSEDGQTKKFKDKSLSTDLYEIIKALLKAEKGK